MKIILITEKDAANASLITVAQEFINRGHSIKVFAPFYSENVLREFIAKNIEVKQFAEINRDVVDDCDIIFSSIFATKWIIDKGLFDVKKFIFTHDYLLHGEMTYGLDFSFATSIDNTASSFQGLLHFAKMGIGEPKYDLLKKSDYDSNRLLFIDSGHYPFGMEGRRALAKTLLEISEKNPDYELCIKPRFLPSDQIITHFNGVHIYDVISEMCNGNIPANMNMLKKHMDLQELINHSKTVICMYTTAYISASLADKGLVILEGLPNEDCFDQRNRRKMIFRDRMRSSSALVYYKNVNDVLPEGIKCDKEHMDHYLVQKNNVASKIVDVCETVYSQYLLSNKFPQNINYKDINDIKERVGATWEDILHDRYLNYLKYRMLITFDYRVNEEIDAEKVLTILDEEINGEKLDYSKFMTVLKSIDNLVFNAIIQNENALKKDDLDKGVLLHAYYWKKEYDKLINFEDKEIGAYYYFAGRYLYDIGQKSKGCEYLEKYYSISKQYDFYHEISDMPNNKMLSLRLMTSFFLSEKNLDKANYYINEWRDFYLATNAKIEKLEDIKDSTKSYELTFLLWYQALVDGTLKEKTKLIIGQKRIALYGAGRISRDIIMCNHEIGNRVCLFFDEYSMLSSCEGIPVSRLKEKDAYNNIDLILVTISYDYNNIYKEIRKYNDKIKILPLWGLIE